MVEILSEIFIFRQESHYRQDFDKLLSLVIFSARWAYSISVVSDFPFQILSRCCLNFLHECRYISASSPYLGRESRSVVGPPLVCIYGVIHTRGWKVVMPGTLATDSTYLYPLPVYWPPSRAPASSFVRGRRGPSYLSRPPMGVVPSSNRDYGLRRGRYSPRAPRTRILYLPEKSSGSLVAHVCTSTVCSGRIGSLLSPGNWSGLRGAPCKRYSIFERYGRAISEGKNNAVTFFHKAASHAKFFCA